MLSQNAAEIQVPGTLNVLQHAINLEALSSNRTLALVAAVEHDLLFHRQYVVTLWQSRIIHVKSSNNVCCVHWHYRHLRK